MNNDGARAGGLRRGAGALAGRRPSAARWVVKGRGWGHGVGMSQYGAYGFAKHGRGYKQILHHYYRKDARSGTPGGDKIRACSARRPDSVGFSGADAPAASGSDGKRLPFSGRAGRRSCAAPRRPDRACGPRAAPAAGRSGSGARALPRQAERQARAASLHAINRSGSRHTSRAWSRTRSRPRGRGGAARAGGGRALVRARDQRDGTASTSTTTPAARSTTARLRDGAHQPGREATSGEVVKHGGKSRPPTSSRPRAGRRRARVRLPGAAPPAT